MDALELIRHETRTAWQWLDQVVEDVEGDDANWWPPGTANSIASNYLHIVVNADVELGSMLFGQSRLVETRFAGDIGQGVPYDAERFDQWPPRGTTMNWLRLRDYGGAVAAQTVALVNEITDDLLRAPIDMTRSGLGVWSGLDIVSLHGWGHVKIHGGEISVVKGLQGAEGYGPGMFGSSRYELLEDE